MRVVVERVRVGERLIMEKLVTWRGRAELGIDSAPGLTVVAGVTGSGKTMLALALWWGVARSLSRVEGPSVIDFARAVASAAGMPVVDGVLRVCLSPHEYSLDVPPSDELCIEDGRVYVYKGMDKREVGVPREFIVAVLSSVIAVPHHMRVSLLSIHNVIEKLRKMELLKDLVEDAPIWTVPLMSPVVVSEVAVGRDVFHDVVFPPGLKTLEIPVELIAEFYREEEEVWYVVERSTGEVNAELLNLYIEISGALKRYAEKQGAFMTPVVYFDDAFDGLDGGLLNEVAKKLANADVSFYIPTHRIEVGEGRMLVATYGLRISRLVEWTPDRRLALVDVSYLDEKMHREEREELCRRLAGGGELCLRAVRE